MNRPKSEVSRALSLIWEPFQLFARLQSASSILLLLCTLAALAWANSRWGASYHHFKEFPLGLHLGGVPMILSLELLVNDGLMAVFFLLVGLEIKREMLAGELASLRQAALPIAGALGGMLVPAGIYLAFNRGGPTAAGWGIPMATDIAFALGVLLLLGKRIPLGLKVFLVALAIIDDIGAILVIAVFYTSQLNLPSLFLALTFLVALAFLNWAGVKHYAPYLMLGFFLWVALLHSGVHATLSGVLLAFCIPHRSRLPEEKFPARVADILERFHAASQKTAVPILNDERVGAIHDLEGACEEVKPMLQRWESKLHPFVSFGILPLFALVNAGIVLSPGTLHVLREPLGLGIILGLFLGKPVGITLFSYLAIRARLAVLPSETTWPMILGAGILGGIGFTMSIFITGLSFSEPTFLDGAKFCVLFASLVSGIAGFAFLWTLVKSKAGQPAAPAA